MKAHVPRPRKIVAASLVFGPYGKFTSLEARLEELRVHVARMAALAAERFPGRPLDIVALPEVIVSGGLLGEASACSFPLEGAVLDAMSSVAREHRTWLTVPLYLAEDPQNGIYRNSVALLDRSGGLAGVYHKIHPVIGHDGKTLEGGITPGRKVPVFECDFGPIGFQICFDVSYDDGWAELGKKGARLVIWPTASPATARPSSLALREGYFILSSTWRNNASLFEPTGMVAAQVSSSSIAVAHISRDRRMNGERPRAACLSPSSSKKKKKKKIFFFFY